MNDKENTQASVPELPDLSYYPSKKQRDEAAGWFERNRARVLAAQAAGKQPMPVDIASIGLMREQLWAAYRASIRAMCALKECGLLRKPAFFLK